MAASGEKQIDGYSVPDMTAKLSPMAREKPMAGRLTSLARLFYIPATNLSENEKSCPI
jgi:hypothetical protein